MFIGFFSGVMFIQFTVTNAWWFRCMPMTAYLLWFFPHGKGVGQATQPGSTSKSFYRSKGFLSYLGIISHQGPALLSDLNPHTHYAKKKYQWLGTLELVVEQFTSLCQFDTPTNCFDSSQGPLCPLDPMSLKCSGPLESSPYMLHYPLVHLEGYSFLSQLISCV